MPLAQEIKRSPRDKDILRRLAGELAGIASLPVHKEKALLWQKLNDRQSVRPMVWINEVCWHEMNVNDELTLSAEHPWAREQEQELRRTLYQWWHLPGDMIVNDFLVCPLAIHSTDFGIMEDVDVVKTDEANDIVSRHFNVQIQDYADLDKIQMPVVTHNREATEICYQTMCEVYGGILPVKKQGQTHIWFTPWDYLIRWWGIEQAMIDFIERPDLVHAAVERMVDAWLVELDQFEQQNLLSLDCNNTRIGSGGYGYTSELPGGASSNYQHGRDEFPLPTTKELGEGQGEGNLKRVVAEFSSPSPRSSLAGRGGQTARSGGTGNMRPSPGEELDLAHLRPHNMWGCSNAQIFSEVSPAMHWEFAVKHDLRWLSRWGLTYYGCCEPLDQKIEILRRIPNLRKISASPWCNVERLAEKVGADYILSRKPNPAVLAGDVWHPEWARDDMRSFLEKAGRPCHVELIMKDISTVRYQPHRLWEWATIAMQVAEEFTK